MRKNKQNIIRKKWTPLWVTNAQAGAAHCLVATQEKQLQEIFQKDYL